MGPQIWVVSQPKTNYECWFHCDQRQILRRHYRQYYFSRCFTCRRYNTYFLASLVSFLLYGSRFSSFQSAEYNFFKQLHNLSVLVKLSFTYLTETHKKSPSVLLATSYFRGSLVQYAPETISFILDSYTHSRVIYNTHTYSHTELCVFKTFVIM